MESLEIGIKRLYDDDDEIAQTPIINKTKLEKTKPHLVHRQRKGVRDVVAFRQSDDVFHGGAAPGNGQHASHGSSSSSSSSSSSVYTLRRMKTKVVTRARYFL